jgi:hypothetical protein
MTSLRRSSDKKGDDTIAETSKSRAQVLNGAIGNPWSVFLC